MVLYALFADIISAINLAIRHGALNAWIFSRIYVVKVFTIVTNIQNSIAIMAIGLFAELTHEIPASISTWTNGFPNLHIPTLDTKRNHFKIIGRLKMLYFFSRLKEIYGLVLWNVEVF